GLAVVGRGDDGGRPLAGQAGDEVAGDGRDQLLVGTVELHYVAAASHRFLPCHRDLTRSGEAGARRTGRGPLCPVPPATKPRTWCTTPLYMQSSAPSSLNCAGNVPAS